MWESRRWDHIKVRAHDSDEHHKYYHCYYLCEASFQDNEAHDNATKELWQTEAGWDLHVARVKTDMALAKRSKHRHRAGVFKDALVEVKAEGTTLGRSEKRSKVTEVFHEKIRLL